MQCRAGSAQERCVLVQDLAEFITDRDDGLVFVCDDFVFVGPHFVDSRFGDESAGHQEDDNEGE